VFCDVGLETGFYGFEFLVLISAFSPSSLYGYMYLEKLQTTGFVMLLVSLPMVSAIFLHVAEHDAEK
jgi:hypothetical protein